MADVAAMLSRMRTLSGAGCRQSALPSFVGISQNKRPFLINGVRRFVPFGMRLRMELTSSSQCTLVASCTVEGPGFPMGAAVSSTDRVFYMQCLSLTRTMAQETRRTSLLPRGRTVPCVLSSLVHSSPRLSPSVQHSHRCAPERDG